MKKSVYFIGCALSLVFFSCSKGDYNSGDGQTGYNRYADKNQVVNDGIFTAKIGGSDFKAGFAAAYYLNIDLSKSLDIVGYKSLGGATADGFSIHLNNNTKGTYTIDVMAGSTNKATYLAPGSSAIVVAQTGKVEITEITDKRVKGTFEMKASGFDATEGKFDVPIIVKTK